MLWIDTPLVQDAKSDLPSFRKMLDALPGPLGKTTSVEACGKAFVKGIEGRKRYVYCPEYVAVLRWLKPLLATRLGRGRNDEVRSRTVAADGCRGRGTRPVD